MKLYTSYYYQIRNFPSNLIGLSTAIWPPKYIKLGEKDKRGVLVIDCPPLKPGVSCEGLCNGKCNPKHPQDCAFLQAYSKQLNKLNFKYFMFQLFNLHERIAYDSDIKDFDFAFIFFEKYDNPCSERWAVQTWLKNHDVKIQEWNV